MACYTHTATSFDSEHVECKERRAIARSTKCSKKRAQYLQSLGYSLSRSGEAVQLDRRGRGARKKSNSEESHGAARVATRTQLANGTMADDTDVQATSGGVRAQAAWHSTRRSSASPDLKASSPPPCCYTEASLRDDCEVDRHFGKSASTSSLEAGFSATSKASAIHTEVSTEEPEWEVVHQYTVSSKDEDSDDESDWALLMA